MIKYCVVALSGALLPFAYAPYQYSILAFLSPAVLFWFWRNATTLRQTFYFGYIYGLSMFGVGVNWIHISINLFGGVTLLVAYAITFLFISVLAFYPSFIGVFSRLIYRGRASVYFLFVLPASWTLFEWIRGWMFTGFPWLNLGASQTDTLLSSYAPVLGVYGVSFIVVLLSSTIVLLCVNRSKWLVLIVPLVILLGAWCLNSVNWTKQAGEPIKVALVQAAIPQEIKWHPVIRQSSYRLYQQLSQKYQKHDLIVWPETAVTHTFYNARDILDEIQTKAQDTGAVFLIGIVYKQDEYSSYNSIVIIDDAFRLYKKQHLVPFGEYVPLKPLVLPVLKKLNIAMSDLSAGTDEPAYFKTRHGVLGLSICYEDAFGAEVRRSMPESEALVNVSNDAWFGDSIAPHQHLQIARMRSIEVSRYMMRATNTGISAIIDQRGNVVSHIPQFRPDVAEGEVHRHKGSTPFTSFGYWPIILLCLVIVLVSILYTFKHCMSSRHQADVAKQ